MPVIGDYAQEDEDGKTVHAASAVLSPVKKAHPGGIPSTASLKTVTNDEGAKQSATLGLFDLIPGEALIRLAEVYGYGAGKYEPRNWHGIPGYDHINHAIEHLAMLEMGRTDEDHLGHALCRLSMAVWAEQNRGDMVRLKGTGQKR